MSIERGQARLDCERSHQDKMVPTNGLGWTGVRCTVCGFSFFKAWEDWVIEAQADYHPTAGDKEKA
jgi:hypothetical protein